MLNRILFDTLGHLARQSLNRELVELRLTRYFTIAELDDGSVGACMSYYRLPDGVLDIAESRLRCYCRHDPFLARNHGVLDKIISDCVEKEEQRDFLLASLTASIASALSASIIRNGGDEDFEVAQQPPRNWADGTESALVVGLGGLLQHLVAEPGIKKVHTIDLLYHPERERFKSQLGVLRAQFPGKSITASLRLDNAAELRSFDLVSITGSTLCNGTLEYFLENVRKDAMVVLQGQSASLHPKVLFEAGVKWVATTLKPKALSQIARGDHSGHMMRPLLEGGLPHVFLVPWAPERVHQRNLLKNLTSVHLHPKDNLD